ncbi:hypothetical protein CJ030_MR2G011920 [Morella rubra]|uniref:GRF-type domain-containing protein n=1 Tax=Morella rubra TaxID=262757 RepID=A0A6A1WEA3_9ROSI|nr:hypothetical protein CJ030_MR2G011920 [Morella rubra]
MESSGSVSFDLGVEAHFCNCDIQASLKTSWTEKNLGRRFWGCPRFGKKSMPLACVYFAWYDPPLYKRTLEFFPPLMRRIKMLEAELQKQREKERRLEIGLVVSCVLGLVGVHVALCF